VSFTRVRGQDRAIALLQRALARGRLAHALIFAGPAGVGKRTTARALAAALFCPQAPDVGCGACEDCRLVASGSHPDLLIEDLARAREDKPTATRLSIDQIRRVRARLAVRALRGRRKVGLIDQAELLTADAQNALLKTLEEPPGETVLVLICTNPDTLLSTIRSRCRLVRFAPLERDIVRDLLILEGTAPEQAESAADLAEGSTDRARALTAEGGLEHLAELRGKLDALGRSTIPQILDLAADLAGPRGDKGRAQQRRNLATVLAWCRDHLLDTASATPPGDDDDHDRLDAIRHALRRAEAAYARSRELERNANTHLGWDRLLLDLRESR